MKPPNKSQEDYLEAILMLQMKSGYARYVDIAAALGFSKPSASRAVSILKENGYIAVSENHEITLTKMGRATAEKIYNKHCVLRDWLISIGVRDSDVEKTACEIEHCISYEVCRLIDNFMKALN